MLTFVALTLFHLACFSRVLMTATELPSFNGAVVDITVDAQRALGVLGFSKEGCATITTLCFVDPGVECPLIQHELTEEEIGSLSLNGPKRLTSGIALRGKTERAVCGVN